MMAVCPVCGKYHVVHWPEHWVYRRREHYLCSEACMIIFDTREYKERVGWIEDYRRRKNMRKKITLEQKKKAVEIALKGGTAPLKYLEECGAANPSASWFYIKKTVKEKDPETWKKLQSLSGETEMEMHMAEVPKPVINLEISAEDLEALNEDAEPIRQRIDVAPVVTEQPGSFIKPLNYDGFDVLTIKNEWGLFHYDAKRGMLYWTSPECEEVGFTPDEWKTFATEILPKAMAILGAVAKN